MKNLFVLKGVGDFAPGAFENTAVEDGSIQLGQRGGEYLQRGSYTSPPMRLAPFTRLLAGWNADTPIGTTVEVQARVASRGQWSKWLSFGIWSPFVYRASMEKQEDSLAVLDGDILRVTGEGVTCDTAQVRIFLNSTDASATPYVRLLAVTVRPAAPLEEADVYAGRELRLPAYSALVRDPSISGHIFSPTTLTMLMNRWGEDVLPEETARAMYDTGAGRYNNLAFVSAAAGMYSYECYPHYCGLDTLRREVQHGHAVAALVAYRVPFGEEEGAETIPGPADGDRRPIWEGAASDSHGHLVALRGFIKKEGCEYAVVNDPQMPSDDAVRAEIPLETFRAMYQGLGFFLHKGPKGAGKAKPERKLASIDLRDGEVLLSIHGELLQPGENIPANASRATIAYTLDDGVAYASAAQKKFHYIFPGEDERFCIDTATLDGQKLSFYLIGSRGTTWVAEKTLPVAGTVANGKITQQEEEKKEAAT